MAKADKRKRVDPAWPETDDAGHPISELAAARQGALSPYGDDMTFPLEHVPYEHPDTRINKKP